MTTPEGYTWGKDLEHQKEVLGLTVKAVPEDYDWLLDDCRMYKRRSEYWLYQLRLLEEKTGISHLEIKD
jgi:hypothetical protein